MAAVVALICLALFYFLGYRLYSGILAEKVFCLSDRETTPAHERADGVDYVPTHRHILWGHHYTSIAGAAPIIGPAVAVIWGWVPALFWVVFGTLFIGAVHDFGALVLSARRGGHTVGDLAGSEIHPRVRVLFQLIIYFLIWVVLAVFAFAIGVLFTRYPETVIPVNFEIAVAVVLGWLFHRKKAGLLVPSLVAVAILYVMVGVGIAFPIDIAPWCRSVPWLPDDPVVTWALFLLAYSAVASVLPVWILLQPRDYINSHQLILGLAGLVLGLLILHPEFEAPALRLDPPGAPPLFPLLFVTIACGAISGFHGLVSSGTTSKQLDRLPDARAIGYGGMLGEGTLALLATLAVAAGLPAWGQHYQSWNASGIRAIAHFVEGAGRFLEALHLPPAWATAVVAVLAISFAATSMDTGARIQRLVVSELGAAWRLRWLQDRYLATLLAVGPAVPLVLAGPKAWTQLWVLFGTTNQLIGGITLLVLFVYLFRLSRPLLHYALPMLFLVVMTTSSMVYNLLHWGHGLMAGDAEGATWLTLGLGTAILILEIWMIAEAGILLTRLRREKRGR